MYRFFLLPLDVAIVGGGNNGIATIASGDDASIFSTFTSIFSTCFDLITGNPALFAILVVAVGAPILGAIISILKGR